MSYSYTKTFWADLIKSHQQEIMGALMKYSREAARPESSGLRQCVFLCEDGKIRTSTGIAGRYGGQKPKVVGKDGQAGNYKGKFISLAEFHAQTVFAKYGVFSHMQLIVEAIIDVRDFELYKSLANFRLYCNQSGNKTVRAVVDNFSGSGDDLKEHLEAARIPVRMMAKYAEYKGELLEFAQEDENRRFFNERYVKYMDIKSEEIASRAADAWIALAEQYGLEKAPECVCA